MQSNKVIIYSSQNVQAMQNRHDTPGSHHVWSNTVNTNLSVENRVPLHGKILKVGPASDVVYSCYRLTGAIHYMGQRMWRS